MSNLIEAGFAKNSSDDNLYLSFRRVKEAEDQRTLSANNNESDRNSDSDNDLTMEELKAAIEEAKVKGPGTDVISYSFFSKLTSVGYRIFITNI